MIALTAATRFDVLTRRPTEQHWHTARYSVPGRKALELVEVRQNAGDDVRLLVAGTALPVSPLTVLRVQLGETPPAEVWEGERGDALAAALAAAPYGADECSLEGQLADEAAAEADALDATLRGAL